MKRIYKVLAALLCVAFLMPIRSVQALEVSKQYISHNRSYQTLAPVGVVIHDTDAPGGTAQNNRDYFNRCSVQASAHYFVDWNQVIQTIPENEVAWHAGYTANHRYLSIEICMPKGHNPLQFNSAYNRAVELTADMCKRYGWGVDKIYSHYWCSYTFKQTDHEDPIAFFKEYGKSMSTFQADVKAVVAKNTTTPVNNVKIATEYLGSVQAVKNMQTMLQMCGYKFYVIDGIIGSKTLGYMEQFCKTNGLGCDYKWGPKCIGKALDFIKAKYKI